jgi:hypothetical protein
MTEAQERRAPGSSRVSLDTLVEICGNEMGTPAFEAEALDVSARGMHLRTAYLPEEGAPLVCRFEDHGREIVVEGVVAWRKESKKGGDFGVKFTALDSRSVDSLRELVKRDVEERHDSNDETARGSRVRLHIQGLGSPMKARVRTGAGQKLKVGSNLEFLKVGRKLEIEDLEAGGRREARIDGVEVVVDAETSVPQLVVALRYEGVEDTPEPSVLDLGGEQQKPASLFIDAGAVTTDAVEKSEPPRSADAASADEPTPSGDAPAATDDDVAEAIPAASRAARRLGTAAEHAGEKAREASIAAAKFGSNAFASVAKLFGGASAKIAALRAAKAGTAKRRTTSPPPDGPMSLEGKRLRPQASKRDGENAEASPAPRPRVTKQRALVAAAGVAVLGTALALATRSGKPEGEKPTAAAVVPQAEAKPAATAAAPVAPEAPVSPPGAPVTANVPLFGPTSMSTAEPAPLGPPPTAESKAVEAAEIAAAKASEPEGAEDEEFVDEPAGKSAKKASADKAGKDVKPEDVAAFGRGKMHLPTIYRIRMDGAGSAIHGAVDPMGFTVLVPGRKFMEQGSGLAKRDSRFARVRTTNTPGGAQVKMAFKSTVPAYRVRLRRDYVEVLISAAAEEPKDKKPVAKEAAKPAAKEGSKPATKEAAKPAAKAKPAGKSAH